MTVKYTLDIHEKSRWLVNTPNDISRRLPFYVNEWGHYFAQSNYYTERKKQRNYLLIYTISGKGCLKYLEQEYILQANQAILIYCEHHHLYKAYQVEEWNFKWLHFNGISAREHYNLLNQGGLNITTIRDPIAFEKTMDDLSQCLNLNDISANVKASAYITNLICSMIDQKFSNIGQKGVNHQKEIRNALEYIQQNYQNKISLDDLTKMVCISKYYFLRLFKCYMGVSPYDYLIHYRVNKSKELLRTTDNPVSEICSMVGFTDSSSFIREFKKIVGVTPQNYRKDR